MTTSTLVSSGAADTAFSADEQRLYIAMGNGDIEVFDLATHDLVTTWHVGSSLAAISVSPDGSFLLAVEHNAGLGLSTVYRVDTADGAKETFSTAGSAFNDVQIVDGQTAIFTGGANQIRQLDLSTGTFSNMTGGVSYSNNGVMTDSGRYTLLAEPGISDGPLFLYDSHAHSFVASGDDYQSPYTGFNWGSQAVSEQAGLVLQFIYYGSINVYNLDLKYLGTVQIGEPIDGLAFDSTGQYVYVHLVSGSVVKYSASPWTAVESYPVTPTSWDNYIGYGNQLLVSQSGEHIAVMGYDGSGNGVVQLIDLPAGSNLVPGTGDADVLVGGAGDDTYQINNVGDRIVEAVNAGVDEAYTVVSFALPDYVENLTLTGLAAIDGTGNELNNVLIGNSAANVLDGAGESDTLIGGAGIDTLTGGSGNDTFRDTAAGLSGDTITDFSSGDKIVISDANVGSFSFSISGHTLTYTGGSLTLSNAPSGTIVASAAAGGGVQLMLPSEAEVAVPHAGDFNGDGRDDVVWRNDGGQVTDWLGQADGGLTANANFNFNPGTDWHVVGSGDFNGDQYDDILWRNDNGTVIDFLGQSNGAFVGNVNFNLNPGLDWHIVGTGDFNGDGNDDILWRSDNGTVVDLLGNTNGSFTGNVNFNLNPGFDWHIVGTGDFNGDGNDDILWRNDLGTVVDLLGNANGSFTGNVNFNLNPGLDWHIVGTGDFNGDGNDDILWRNDLGAVTDLLGQPNGSFVGNIANLNVNPGTDWHVQDSLFL